ncbi:unnamed protein product [Protopolystoma xenopodis]|uniref:Uncharacterized protein n=1 Tax=Protopolystoma xenopodis TaxID=117903 RepID=A0A448WKC3_9PLAT|nr:unnamed protein product [Protopolystoma xenopodis]
MTFLQATTDLRGAAASILYNPESDVFSQSSSNKPCNGQDDSSKNESISDDSSEQPSQPRFSSTPGSLMDPVLSIDRPMFLPTQPALLRNFVHGKMPKTSIDSSVVTLRLQDDAVQQMEDKAVCLSMHQPWASLLVRGIKT